MEPLKYSSDLFSKVNIARRIYWKARENFGRSRGPDANMSFSKASKILAAAKRHLKVVAYEARGVKYTPTEVYDLEDYPAFKVRVAGIPAYLVVVSGSRREPGTRWEPEIPAEAEWVVTNDRGYRATWLEEKLTKEESHEFEEMALTLYE